MQVDRPGPAGRGTQLASVVKVASGGHPVTVQGAQAGGEGGVLRLGGARRGPGRGGGLGRGARDPGTLVGAQAGLHAPVARGGEGHALALALDHQAGGHGLDAPGGQPGTDLAPQDRGDLVAHEPVQDAAGLLGVHAVGVQVAGVGQGAGDGLAGDLREGHALDGDLGLEDLEEVPGNGLSLTVIVGGQVELVGTLEGLAQGGDGLALVGVDHVVGGEPVLHVHGEPAVGTLLHVRGQLGGLGEVTDVPHGGGDLVVVPQVAGDRADLVGGLDDDKLVGHGNPPGNVLGAPPLRRRGRRAGHGRLDCNARPDTTPRARARDRRARGGRSRARPAG